MGFRQAVVALGAVLVVAACAGPASASTWTVRELDDGPVVAFLWGVSCPAPSLCVVVGTNSTIATSTDPSGGASAWKAVHPEGYFTPPPQPPGQPEGEHHYRGNAIRGVSCPSRDLCAAAGPQGNLLVSTDPTGPVSAWEIFELGPEAAHMTAISCPTPSLCVAVAYNGKIITSTDPTGGASAWAIAKLGQPFDSLGVSCPSVSLCVAVDNEGRIATSRNPTGGPSAWRVVGPPAGPSSLGGVSCPAVSLCVTGNAGQMITSTDPDGGLSSWKAVSAGTGLPVKGVSCPSASACAAVDNNADVITSTDPTGGSSAWSFVNAIPAPSAPTGEPNGMFGISCPSTSLCIAAGQGSRIIASSDPFAEDAKPIADGRSRRPRVRITHHPLKRLDPRKGGVKVGFRFRANQRGARFKCKLRGRRFTPCASPRRYRLGSGRYAFKVFAIGSDGLRGPTATFRFRVGRLTERPPLATCKPGQESTFGRPCVAAR